MNRMWIKIMRQDAPSSNCRSADLLEMKPIIFKSVIGSNTPLWVSLIPIFWISYDLKFWVVERKCRGGLSRIKKCYLWCDKLYVYTDFTSSWSGLHAKYLRLQIMFSRARWSLLLSWYLHPITGMTPRLLPYLANNNKGRQRRAMVFIHDTDWNASTKH